MVTIVFMLITLLFSPLVFHAEVQAEVLLPSVALEVQIPEDKVFDEIRKYFFDFKFQDAIRLTKKLKKRKENKSVSKAAAFLLGDLYIELAIFERPAYYNKALITLQQARRRYAGSDEAIVALWKIGIIYMKKGLHYEAIGAFSRIINRHPDSPMAISARFGKAQTLVTMKEWENAIAVYDGINPAQLSNRIRMVLLLGYGDTYFELGYINTAYEYYKLIPANEPVLQLLPISIFKYGIAALRMKDYAHSRKLFSILDNKYPGGPETLLALARIGDSWREQGMSFQADRLYTYVAAFQKYNTNGQKAKLIAAVGQLHLAGCFPRPVLIRVSECEKMKALENESGISAIRTIEDSARSLIGTLNRSPRIEQLLIEAIAGLERHKAFTSSLMIKEGTLALNEKKLTAKTRSLLEKHLKKTVINAVHQLTQGKANVEALTFFFRYNDFFSHGKIDAEIALRIGIILTEAGFHQQAVEHLAPMAGEKNRKNAQIALFYLIQAEFQQGNYLSVEKNINRFLARYPKSPRISMLQVLSAEMSDHQGKMDLAIKRYATWLKQNPKDQKREEILNRLAKAYEKKGNLKQAIAIYRKIDKEDGRHNANLHLKLADLFFRVKNYKTAISYYDKTLIRSEDKYHKEWATLQLARSYESLGQEDKGSPLFTLLAGDAKDDIIKGLAQQKAPRPQTQ
ncbi:tetratricopeptide repeat protein [Nitrospira defluvii]|nr:tetratricopeptide repeat protein [Nitrospira defluvii]